MSIDLADVIADLPNLGAARAATMAPMSPPPPAGMGALAYGTPPGTPSTDGVPYLDADQTHLPAHLIGLPPSDAYPVWDGTYPTPRRPARQWLLPVLFVLALALATGLTIAIARAVG